LDIGAALDTAEPVLAALLKATPIAAAQTPAAAAAPITTLQKRGVKDHVQHIIKLLTGIATDVANYEQDMRGATRSNHAKQGYGAHNTIYVTLKSTQHSSHHFSRFCDDDDPTTPPCSPGPPAWRIFCDEDDPTCPPGPPPPTESPFWQVRTCIEPGCEDECPACPSVVIPLCEGSDCDCKGSDCPDMQKLRIKLDL